MNHDNEPKIALFIDYDNIAIGLREAGGQTFDINLILERILEKGRIIFKRAYADWYLFSDAKRKLHEYGIEMIDIPMRRNIGKNSADIRMVVDALDLCYTKEHIDTFVIGSGDSDFTPLVSKLKENNKEVIGFGLRMSTSNLLANNCDEFIFYEDLASLPVNRPQMPSGLTKRQHDAFNLVMDAVSALIRESKDVLWGSLIKDTIRRKRPSFNESQFGYNSFSQLLEDAARHQLIGMIKDPKSGGTPVVTGFGSAGESALPSSRSVAPAQPRGGSSLAINTDAARSLPAIPATDSGEEKKASPLKKPPIAPKRARTKPADAPAEGAKEAVSGAEEAPKKPTRSRRAPRKSTRKPAAETAKKAEETPAEVASAEKAPEVAAVDTPAEEKPKKAPAKRAPRKRSTTAKSSSAKNAKAESQEKAEPAKGVSESKSTEPTAEKAASAPAAAPDEPKATPAPASAPAEKAEEKPKPMGRPLRQTGHRRRR